MSASVTPCYPRGPTKSAHPIKEYVQTSVSGQLCLSRKERGLLEVDRNLWTVLDPTIRTFSEIQEISCPYGGVNVYLFDSGSHSVLNVFQCSTVVSVLILGPKLQESIHHKD